LRNIRVGLLSVARRARKNLAVDMQNTRLKLINDLQAMFNMAKGYATHQDTKDKQRQIWIRIMAYIGQVMNSISKSFDEAAVTRDLEKLESMIHEAMAKEENRGVNAASTGPSASQET